MTSRRINKTAVDGLEAHDKDRFLWDTDLKGFGVKVTPKGRKVYILDYRMPGSRKVARFTIGQHGSPWTADMARKEASKLRLQVSQGSDPNAEKRCRRAETVDYSFEAYADRFQAMYLHKHWPGSFDRAASVLRRHAKPFFKKRDIRSISKAECSAFIDSLNDTEATARKAAEIVGKLFRWAEDRGDLEHNPMDRVPRPKPSRGRERVLTDTELKRTWAATDRMANHPFGSLVRFLLLCGQRRGEVSGMRWDELDFERRVWEVPVDRTKSKRGNVVPLTDEMIAVLRQVPRLGPLVFSVTGNNELGNHSKLKKRLDAQIEALSEDTLPPWTLHDLRRTVATRLQELGVASDLIEVIQGRTKKLGAGARYQRYDYLREKREALELWNSRAAQMLAFSQP